MKTKDEMLAQGLQEYIKLRKSQDECSGFIDGFNFRYNIPDQQTKELREEIERKDEYIKEVLTKDNIYLKDAMEEIERLKERIQHLTPIDDDYYNH